MPYSIKSVGGLWVVEGTLAEGVAVEIPVPGKIPLTVWSDPVPGDFVVMHHKVHEFGPPMRMRYRELRSGLIASEDPGGYMQEVIDFFIYSVTFQRTSGIGTASAFGMRCAL